MFNTPTIERQDAPPQQGSPGIQATVFNTSLATISPSSLFTGVDIPDLRGQATVDVPGSQGKDPVSNEPLKGTPRMKWGMSRQIRIKIKSPQMPTGAYQRSPGIFIQGLPTTGDNWKLVCDYPTDDVEGNDDPGDQFKDLNPYSDKESISFDKFPVEDGLPKPAISVTPAVGQLGDLDAPNLPSFDSNTLFPNKNPALVPGLILEFKIQFRDFARVQLGNTWYRISDLTDGLFRYHVTFTDVNDLPSYLDGSEAAINNDDW